MAKLTAIQLPDGTIVDVADKVSGYITAEEAPVTDVEVNGSSVVTNGVAEITVPTDVSDLVNDAGYLTTETDPTVPSWAKQSTKPSYTATEVGALPDDTFIPTNVSDLVNDEGYISSETDPTVPLWAKAPTKPAYTASEVGALPASTVIPSKTSDLTNDSGFITASNIPEEIFIAEYDTTAYSDILAAYNAGKTILCHRLYSTYGINEYAYLVDYTAAGGRFIFSRTQPDSNDYPTAVYITCNLYDEWTENSIALATIAHLPTKVSDLTNDSGFITVNDVPEEIFIAGVGTTTYVDVLAAANDGKIIMLVDDGVLLPCSASVNTNNVSFRNFNNGFETTYIVTASGWTSTNSSFVRTTSLATVATSGSYNDLSNRPTVSNVQIVRWSEENN